MHTGLIVLAVFFVAFALVWGLYAAAQRRKELSAWAQSHGLSFSPSKRRDLEDRLPEFACLRRGHSRYGRNLIEGDWNGARLLCFDYHYTTGSGKNRNHHSFTAVVMEGPVPLKPLYIRPEGIFDKITEFFGVDDIDFESAEFSRKFYVKSPDKRWAYDVIHQRMMEYLLESPRYNVQFGRREAMIWRGRCLDPNDFEAAVKYLEGIFARFPDYLLRDRTARA